MNPATKPSASPATGTAIGFSTATATGTPTGTGTATAAFLIYFLTLNTAQGQSVIIDSCFTSCVVSTSFMPSPYLTGFDSDLMEWDGTVWNGIHPNSLISIPPLSQTAGRRRQAACSLPIIGTATAYNTSPSAPL